MTSKATPTLAPVSTPAASTPVITATAGSSTPSLSSSASPSLPPSSSSSASTLSSSPSPSPSSPSPSPSPAPLSAAPGSPISTTSTTASGGSSSGGDASPKKEKKKKSKKSTTEKPGEDKGKEKEKKPKDTDFEPYASRPFIEGVSIVDVPHMHDKSRPVIQHEIPNHWLQFKLQPKYLGDGEDRVIYYDAQDPQFYYMDLPKPDFYIWLLIKNTNFAGGGYVKRRLVEEGFRLNYAVKLVNPNKFDLQLSHGFETAYYNGTKIALPDAVIPRVGANVDYFGLAVMRQLESLGVKVFNPSSSIEISRDKLYTHQVLAAAGIPIPKSVLSRYPFDTSYIENHFGYPVVVKLTSSSKGDAVWKVDDRNELETLVKTLDTTKPIIFQEFLANSKGRDLRCFVIGQQVIACMMRIAATGFKANVHQGGSVRNVSCAPGLADLVLTTNQLCGLDISGVDVLLDASGYKICEVNSSPGFQGLEQATQVNVARIQLRYVFNTVDDMRKKGTYLRKDNTQITDIPLQPDHKHLMRLVGVPKDA